jgi:hypothetical protein
MSRFDAINILERFVRTKRNRARGAIILVEKLDIIHEFVKKL